MILIIPIVQAGREEGLFHNIFLQRKKVLGPEEVESQTPWLSCALQAKLNVWGQAASL